MLTKNADQKGIVKKVRLNWACFLRFVNYSTAANTVKYSFQRYLRNKYGNSKARNSTCFKLRNWMKWMLKIYRKTFIQSFNFGIFYTILAQWEETQRKTYTKWVNLYLSKRRPPVKLNDIIEDFKGLFQSLINWLTHAAFFPF